MMSIRNQPSLIHVYIYTQRERCTQICTRLYGYVLSVVLFGFSVLFYRAVISVLVPFVTKKYEGIVKSMSHIFLLICTCFIIRSLHGWYIYRVIQGRTRTDRPITMQRWLWSYCISHKMCMQPLAKDDTTRIVQPYSYAMRATPVAEGKCNP